MTRPPRLEVLGADLDRDRRVGDQVVIPVRVGRGAGLRREDVDPLRVGVIGQVHQRATCSAARTWRRWWSADIGAPSKLPPTRPSFARNSLMIWVFQSSAMSRPERATTVRPAADRPLAAEVGGDRYGGLVAALDDIVVVDLTRALAGPHAAMMLGDLGRAGDQGRVARRRRHPRLGSAVRDRRRRRRALDLLHVLQSQQGVDRPRPQVRRRPRRPDPAGRARRRADRELPLRACSTGSASASSGCTSSTRGW